MATIIRKNKKYCVVYSYRDEAGKRKQNGKPLRVCPRRKPAKER